MKFEENSQRILVTLAIVLINALTTVLLFFRPSGGTYEGSIYQSFPFFFWISLSGVFTIGAILCLYDIFFNRREQNYFLLGLLILLPGFVILVSLIAIRGYHIWSLGDPATHYFYIMDVYHSGFIREGMLIYPLLHLYSSIIMIISNVDLLSIQKILPIYLYLLFPFFMLLLSRKIFTSKKSSLLAFLLAFSFIMYYPYFNECVPQLLSDVVLVMILFCIFMCISFRSIPFTIIAIIGILSSTLTHPLCTIIITIFIIAMALDRYVLKLNLNERAFQLGMSTIKLGSIEAVLLALTCVFFVWWISLFSIFDSNVVNIINLILFESGASQVSKVENLYDLGNFYGYNMVFEIIKRYLGNLVCIVGGIIITSFCLLTRYVNKITLSHSIVKLFIFFGLSLLLTGLFLLTSMNINIWRFITYPTIIGMLILGLTPSFLEHIFRENLYPVSKKLISIGICFVLILIFVNGIFVTYPSTYLHMNNYQVTMYDTAGMSFLFTYEDDYYPRVAVSMSDGRFGHLLLTYNLFEKKDLHVFKYYKTPYHFGYDSYSTLGESYSTNVYLDLHEKDKWIYSEVHSLAREFTYLESDFDRLNLDTTVNNIYDNGEFQLQFIYGSNTSS